MCICATGEHCACYGSEAQYHAERALQAHFSAIEHEVLDVLLDATPDVSPLARCLVALIDADPVSVVDVLATNGGIYWWLSGSGAQYHAQLRAWPAVRLVA
ncbi:hypothetical protein [Paraburkholderia sp. HD33-4]|uniref:hypothetical protein n=1 Tax=Paraburkholderia sp. HD33-4 TaxID=2883242 RepID=UPI001F2B583D|nr:hypothetical protein [Paraburkholderia sp. HD33-4]